MEFSLEDSESALLQLIEVLGNTLARLQATHAKEEYELQQIVASIKFVNRTAGARNNSSQEPDPESPEVHVYESDMSEVSKSIDAILDEARTVRGTSKSSANPKGPSSTPRDVADIAETQARKSNAAAAVQKKKLERVTQPLRRRTRKAVSSLEDAERSSFPAAKEMLLRWMANKKDGSWIDTHVERQQRRDRKITEKTNAEKRFLDRLWSIRSTPLDSSTNAEDGAAGDDPNEKGHGKDDPNAAGTDDEIQRATQRMLQMNGEMSQAQWNLMNERLLNARHLRPGEDCPFMTNETQHEKESAAGDNCWLSAEICEKVLGNEVKGIASITDPQQVPIVYSDLQQALTMTQLMHSIRVNIFNCYLQSLLAETFLKTGSPLTTRSGEDVINNPTLYLCFRLAHCLVFNNGKALLTIARRVEMA